MLRLGRPFALVAAAFSILMLAVLDRVLVLAGGPLLCVLLPHVVGWLTLGSGCLSSILQLSGFLSLLPSSCV